MLPLLRSCNIIELDFNNEILWAWSFPTVTCEQKTYVLRKFSDIGQDITFAFGRFKNEWCYIQICQVFESDVLEKVKQFALVIWSTEYHPEKYNTLCRFLSKRYCKTGDPCVVLQLYLSVMTTGVCDTEENGTFLNTNFSNGPVKQRNTSYIIELISTLGLETILVYTALLLNKRLIVYDHNLSNLLLTMESLPLLMTHRDLKKSLYPWIHMCSDEINELRTQSGFLAGTLDSGAISMEDDYDVFVNMAAREITIAPHAREVFTMTKTHKDIALFMVRLAEERNQDIINEISKKTDDVITQLRSLATTEVGNNKMISMETLKEKAFPPALENFLFNLALAENVMLL